MLLRTLCKNLTSCNGNTRSGMLGADVYSDGSVPEGVAFPSDAFPTTAIAELFTQKPTECRPIAPNPPAALVHM